MKTILARTISLFERRPSNRKQNTQKTFAAPHIPFSDRMTRGRRERKSYRVNIKTDQVEETKENERKGCRCLFPPIIGASVSETRLLCFPATGEIQLEFIALRIKASLRNIDLIPGANFPPRQVVLTLGALILS